MKVIKKKAAMECTPEQIQKEVIEYWTKKLAAFRRKHGLDGRPAAMKAMKVMQTKAPMKAMPVMKEDGSDEGYVSLHLPPQGPLLFFQRGRRARISKKEKEKGKRTRKKEDGKEESKKSKAHLIHSGPNSRSPAPSGNYWYHHYY